MPEIRIRDGLPCKGVALPTRFVEPGRWYEVDDATAAYAATVRLHPTSVTSPLVFEMRDVTAVVKGPPSEASVEKAKPAPEPEAAQPEPQTDAAADAEAEPVEADVAAEEPAPEEATEDKPAAPMTRAQRRRAAAEAKEPPKGD